MIFPQMVTERHYQVVERQLTVGGGTAISGGGTPDKGGGTPFRPIPAEFNHCIVLISARQHAEPSTLSPVRLSVHPSVCHNVTRLGQPVKMVEFRIMQFSPTITPLAIFNLRENISQTVSNTAAVITNRQNRASLNCCRFFARGLHTRAVVARSPLH